MFYTYEIPKKPALYYKWKQQEFFIDVNLNHVQYNKFIHSYKYALDEVEDYVFKLIDKDGIDPDQIFAKSEINEYSYEVTIGWWAPMTEAEKKRAQEKRRQQREKKKIAAEKQRKEDEKLYDALVKKYPGLLDRREK